MGIKFDSELEKQFKENDKRIRMWATWKLKTQELDLSGKEQPTTWDRMSKHDQEFNLVWNELMSLCHKATLPKLKRILEGVKEHALL